MLLHGRQVVGTISSLFTPSELSNLYQPPTPGSALLCCSIKVHGQLLPVLHGSTGQVPTMVAGGIIGYSYQTIPHYPLISRSCLSSLCPHPLFLFLFHFPITYLLLLVCAGSLSIWGDLRCGLSSTMTLSCCIMVPRRGHLRHGLPPKACTAHTRSYLRLASVQTPWHWTGGSLRLAVFREC